MNSGNLESKDAITANQTNSPMQNNMEKLTPEEWQKVVAIGLLTDGDIYYRKWDNKHMIRFYSTDTNMHEFFQKIVLLAFGENRSAFLSRKQDKELTTFYQRGTKNPMIVKLFSFSKDYKTKKGSEPSLNFLLNERQEVKIQAIRFAMSCDGSVSIKRSPSNRCYALKLACAHPELMLQWQKIFDDVGIEMRISRDRATWSGIQGLETGNKKSFQRFAEMGGFLPENVKVTNGNFVGCQKNDVLKRILEERKITLANGF